MTLLKVLDVLKTQHYEVWFEGQVVGIIKRDFLSETDANCSLIFSSQDLLDFLQFSVIEILPLCTDPGNTKCGIILDEVI